MTSDNDTRQILKAVNTSFAYEVQFFFLLISVLVKNLRIHREIINKKKVRDVQPANRANNDRTTKVSYQSADQSKNTNSNRISSHRLYSLLILSAGKARHVFVSAKFYTESN